MKALVLTLVVIAGCSAAGVSQTDRQAGAANVREENDWVADGVARFPDRIIGFCSVNPLRDYAVAEIDRCATNRHISGLKLHLANSGVDLTDTTHVKRVAAAFEAANRHGLAIVMHMWTPAWVADPTRGSADAEVVLKALLPLAPHVPVQLAHLAGGGSFGEGADRAVSTFIPAIKAESKTVANLYFDIAVVVNARQPLWVRTRIAERIREIGIKRILYGTDGTRAAENWAELRTLLPLTVDEFAVMRANRLPTGVWR